MVSQILMDIHFFLCYTMCRGTIVKYLFIPGMNVTEQEFLTVKGLFMKENLFLEGLLENHLHFTTSKKSKL